VSLSEKTTHARSGASPRAQLRERFERELRLARDARQ